MANRVTNNMMYGTLFSDMQHNLSEMLKLQDQMSKQRRFSNISDDPIAVTRGLSISTSIFENEQYMKNQQDAVSWLRASYNTFDQLLTDAQRIRELVIQAGNGALTDEELKAISTEIMQIKESMRNTANSSIAGKYLLSGLDTGTKPFTYDAFGRIVYGGSDKKIHYEIEKSVVSEVSFTGSEVFGDTERSYNVKSHYVPLDWTWTGRSEKIQIRLGDDTIVSVQIPEIWIDEIATGNTEFSDFNQFRDPDELRGLTMDQLAEIFSRSIKDGGADKLIGVKVEKDLEKGIQRLVFTSNTGQPLQITGWPNTDMAPLEQSIAGLVIQPTPSINWSNNVLMGNIQVAFPITNDISFTLTLKGEDDDFHINLLTPVGGYETIEDLVLDLNAEFANLSPSPNVTARHINGQLIIEDTEGREISVSGTDASKLFGSIKRSAPPETKGLMGTVNAEGWVPDGSATTKFITITANGKDERFDLNDYSDIYKLVSDINQKIKPMSGEPDVASIVNGRICLSIAGEISVDGTGVQELFGVNGPIDGTASSLEFKVGNDHPVRIFISEGDTLEDIALKVEAITGMAARVSPDGTQLIVVAKRNLPYPDSFLNTNVAAETLAYPKFSVTATGAAVQLFDFQLTTDTTTGNMRGSTVSQEVRRAVDHSHIDLLGCLGMETALKSVEFPAGERLTVEPPGLHWRIMSGNNVVDLRLSPGEYDMEQLAERLRNAGLGWLEVTVSNFMGHGQPNQDAAEAGLVTSNNYEGATSRLVIKAVQNMPVIFLDMNNMGYADMMGLSTAIRTDNNANDVFFPGAECLDTNTPAYLKVVVGDGKTYTVKLNRKDVMFPGTNLVDRNKVMDQIAKQVNEQSGMELLRVIKTGTAPNQQSSLFSTTGEPVSIIDMPVPDSSWITYSMGIATQMGIHAGITATPAMRDNVTVGGRIVNTDPPEYDTGIQDMITPGTIRIRSMGRSIDIDVTEDDTVKDILDKIRDQAGDWLEINYFDPNMGLSPESPRYNDDASVMFAICAKDGSAVSIYDLSGNVAKRGLLCDNAINGTVDLREDDWPTFSNGDVLTISVAGYSHTIDLYAAQQSVGDFTPQALADLINARFQGDDLRAELNGDGQMIIYSPRGHNTEIKNTPAATLIFGAPPTNVINGTIQLVDSDGIPTENWPTFASGDILTINVAGYDDVVIDLFQEQEDAQSAGGVFTPGLLVGIINTHFNDLDPDLDLIARIGADGQMIIESPSGSNYHIAIDEPADALIFSSSIKNPARGGAPNSINNQQNITVRSGANTAQANFFDVLNNLAITIESGNTKALSEHLLPQIDRFIDNLLKCMATQGALENRYTNNVYRFMKNNTALTDLWDDVVGIDLSKAATDFAMLAAMYEASLAVVSRVIQPTLLDFLR